MENGFNQGYALVIGINAYQHFSKLEKATTDAQDLCEVLVENCGYPQAQVALLKDKQASKRNISNRLRWLASRAGPEDTVIIFFAGHGVRPVGGFEQGEYLCPVNADPDNLAQSAISSQELTSALGAIRAKRLVVFLDACHAGGVGQPRDADQAVEYGFSEAVYARFSAGEGRVIIASCKPHQSAWELSEMPNGLFTHFLLMGLRGEGPPVEDGMVHILDLFKYLSDVVPRYCQEEDLDVQEPLLKAQSVDRDFPVALLAQAPPRILSPEELQDWEPFRDLVKLVRRGKAIPVIGHGVSAEVGMPALADLLPKLQDLADRRSIEVPDEASFYQAVSILEENRFPREEVVRLLRNEYARSERVSGLDFQHCPKGAYRLLPTITQFQKAFITTNWDDLLSRALDNSEEILKTLQIVPDSVAQTPVIRLRGGFDDEERMLISKVEPDAVMRLIRQSGTDSLWQELTNPREKYTFVLMGYEQEDEAFRLVQEHILNVVLPSTPHFYVAPLFPDEEKRIYDETGARAIPTTAANLMLALFRELSEFADRLSEQDVVFEDKYYFIEFYGNFGSGKSALLDAAAKRAEGEGWDSEQILWMSFAEDQDGALKAQVVKRDADEPEYDGDLRGLELYLQASDGVFLILDATEGVQLDVMERILSVTAPAILRLNGQNKRSKLLLAGLRAVKGWPSEAFPHRYSHNLQALTRDYVHEMAIKYLLAADPDSQEEFAPELISDILEVSGGHPGFVKSILTDLTAMHELPDAHVTLPPRLTRNRKEGYVTRFNGDIDRNVNWGHSPLIKSTYEDVLCVFRRLNREILGQLDIPMVDPLPDLIDLHLLSDKGFSANSVIRHTKRLHLQCRDPEAHRNVHEIAQEIFRAGLSELVDETQRDYMLEWFFHTAHLLIIQIPSDVNERSETLLRSVEPFQFRVHFDLKVPGICLTFVDSMAQDFELWSLLDACIGRESLDVLRDILREKEVIYV